MTRKKLTVAVAGIVIFVGFVGMVVQTQAAGVMPAKTEQPSMQAVPNENVRVTFIELGSVNCIPCKMMQPIMAEIEKDYGAQVKVVFYDVWTQAGQPYARKYQVRAIPTQVFLDKDGIEYFRHMGFFAKAEIVKVLQKQGVK